MPGIPSSFQGLQILEGKDTTIEVEDYLGGESGCILARCPATHVCYLHLDQEQSAEYFCDFHSTMEHKLKM